MDKQKYDVIGRGLSGSRPQRAQQDQIGLAIIGIGAFFAIVKFCGEGFLIVKCGVSFLKRAISRLFLAPLKK